MMPLIVKELFGPTIQGEGRAAGQRAKFIRLAGCNLSCPWCDTPYARADKGQLMSEEAIVQRLDVRKDDLVVITGGEPMLQGIEALVDLLHWSGASVHLETNGSRFRRFITELTNVSPKLYALNEEYRDSLRQWARTRADWKFVVHNEEDVAQVCELSAELGIHKQNIWLMPLGATREEQVLWTPLVAQWAVDAGFNFSPRLHVLAWDEKRGV